MSVAKVLKSAFFGYLLLGSPEGVYADVQGLSFQGGNNAKGVIEPDQGFCLADNFSFADPNFAGQLQENYFATRDVEDLSFALDSSDVSQDSWRDSILSFVSRTYQATIDLLFARWTPNLLKDAINEGDLQRVERLIQRGADVNFHTIVQKPPLFGAIEQGNLAIVQALIDAGADVNFHDIFGLNDISALFIAIKQGDLAIVQALIKAGADLNFLNSYKQSPLIVAIKEAKWDIALELIQAKADVNYSCDIFDETALIAAIKQKNLNMVQALIKVGVDVNWVCSSGANPLNTAVYDGNSDIFYALIQAGAKITSYDCDFVTYFAIEQNDLELLQKLIDSEVFDSRAATRSVRIALINGNLKAAKKVIKTKYFDSEGATNCMREAIIVGDLGIVKAIIEAGADVNFIFVNLNGWFGNLYMETPLILARKQGNVEIIQALEEANADERLDEIELHSKKYMLLKLLGHAFEFDLTVPFLPDEDLELEGMFRNEVFDLSEEMQINKFYKIFYDITAAFFKKLKIKHNFDVNKILSALNNPIWGKNKEKRFPDIDIVRIQQSNGTIIIHWAGDSHAIDIIFSDGYLLICNKGGRDKKTTKQIEAYKIDPNKLANIEQIFKDLEQQYKDLSREERNNFSILYRDLPKAFEGKKDWVCGALPSLVTTNQVVGNCPWESPETGLEALMGLDYLLRHPELERQPTSVVTEHLDRDVHQIMEKWRRFAKEYVLAKYEEFHEEHKEIPIDEELYQKAKAALSE